MQAKKGRCTKKDSRKEAFKHFYLVPFLYYYYVLYFTGLRGIFVQRDRATGVLINYLSSLLPLGFFFIIFEKRFFFSVIGFIKSTFVISLSDTLQKTRSKQSTNIQFINLAKRFQWFTLFLNWILVFVGFWCYCSKV